MAKITVNEIHSKYPNSFSEMKQGDYAAIDYCGKEEVVIKTIDDSYQMLSQDNGYYSDGKLACRILPTGTKIEITV